MAAILQIIKDYGPAAAAIISIIAIIVVFIINSKVAKTLHQILKLKDETRNEKSKVIVEAFNVINKLEQTEATDYAMIAGELDIVYNRMYSVLSDSKLIQAYDRVVTTFIIGTKASLTEFEVLARKELGLTPVNNKSKQNYLLMINDEQRKVTARLQLEQQKREQEMELERQKEAMKAQKEQEILIKKQEKEAQKQSRLLEIKKQKEMAKLPKEQETIIEKDEQEAKEQVNSLETQNKKEDKSE